MISERLFALIDQDNNEYLDIQEFINGLSKLFDDCYDNQINFIFKFYDFNRDGFISREDINVVLCYLPLNCPKIANMMNFKYEKEEFDMRIESQEEIHKIVEKIFQNDKYIDEKKFIEITEEVCSEAFLYVFIILKLVINIFTRKETI